MIGVLFATVREAAPFLDLIGQRQREQPLPLFYSDLKSDGLLTVISGMGPKAAGAAARLAIEDYGVRRLVNAGICGALRTGSDWVPGGVFVVRRASAIDLAYGSQTGALDCDRLAWHCLPAADWVTCDRPLFNAELRGQLAAWGALVDMEGASVAAVARDGGVPCTLIKGITDFAAEGERASLHRRLEGVSRQIAKILLAGLNHSEPTSRGSSGLPH